MNIKIVLMQIYINDVIRRHPSTTGIQCLSGVQVKPMTSWPVGKWKPRRHLQVRLDATIVVRLWHTAFRRCSSGHRFAVEKKTISIQQLCQF